MKRFIVTLKILLTVLALPAALQAEDGPDSPFATLDEGASAASESHIELSAEVADVVWQKIDANRDGRATDKEAYAAIKPLRVIANAKESTPLSQSLKKAANRDEVELVSKGEVLAVIAQVRGERCPTAKSAKEFFDRLDANENGTLEGLEMQAALKQLGDVGKVLFRPVGTTVKSMDLNGDNLIGTDEVYLSANAMLRVKLATDGPGIAQRDPGDWLNFVQAVAYLDADADNVVSPVEAMQVKAVGLQFASIDRNRDQKVTVGEFCDYQSQLDLAAQLRNLSNSSGGFS